MNREEMVRAYFSAWLTKDAAGLDLVFADGAIYTECYGPQYCGLAQVRRWFADWNLRGTVLRWDIKNMIGRADTLCVEWYFECEYDGEMDGFDGVSWIEFDGQGKIIALREFESKAQHHFPYGQP